MHPSACHWIFSFSPEQNGHSPFQAIHISYDFCFGPRTYHISSVHACLYIHELFLHRKCRQMLTLSYQSTLPACCYIFPHGCLKTFSIQQWVLSIYKPKLSGSDSTQTNVTRPTSDAGRMQTDGGRCQCTKWSALKFSWEFWQQQVSACLSVSQTN